MLVVSPLNPKPRKYQAPHLLGAGGGRGGVWAEAQDLGSVRVCFYPGRWDYSLAGRAGRVPVDLMVLDQRI